MGLAGVAAKGGAVLVVLLAAGIAYLQLYVLKYRHSRDNHAPTDRQTAAQMVIEGFDVIQRNKPVLTKFEQSMYDKVAAGQPPLKGKVVVLTGATKGLGRGMAAHLAAFGATLVLPCRRCNFDEFKQQVKSEAKLLYNKYKPKNAAKATLDQLADPYVFDVDLADLDLIDAFVDWYATKSGLPAADYLINNAGLVSMDVKLTKQGFESTFAVNFLASAYLTDQFLKRNLVTGRIVSVSSEDHRAGAPIAEVLSSHNAKFGQPWGSGLLDAMARYDYSKLLQTTYFLALSRKTKIPIVDLCPGPIASEISMSATWPINILVKSVLDRIFVSIDQAAIPVLRLALDESFAKTTGKHYHIAEERPARDDATDHKIQDQLYNWTQELFRTRAAPK